MKIKITGVHPAAELFPLMEGAEFDALVADIKANGLHEPIVLFRGKIVDGRNRYRALQQLGIRTDRHEDYYYFRKLEDAIAVTGERDSERVNSEMAQAYVISKNIHRRHLTAEQKRELIAKLLKATPEKSDRQIAETVKVSPTTVGKVRRSTVQSGQLKRVGKDGKARKQPKARPELVQFDAFHHELLKWHADYADRLRDWLRSAPTISKPDRAALGAGLHYVANDLSAIAQQLMGYASKAASAMFPAPADCSPGLAAGMAAAEEGDGIPQPDTAQLH